MPTPPRADARPAEVDRRFETVVDPYAWLRNRDDPDVRAYLEAENAYVEDVLGHLRGLRQRLFDEIRRRVQETDASVPAQRGEWWYLTRTEEGKAYPIHCRRRGGPDGPEEVWFDENAEAAAHEYFSLGGLSVSPDHRVAAYAVDLDGSEVFSLRFRDLGTGEDLPDEVARVHFGLAWANDSRTILYTVPDEAWRPHEVRRHVLGTDPVEDEVVHVEPDGRFWLGVSRTRSDRFITIEAGSKITSEVHLLDADDPTGTPRLVAARETGVEYGGDHRGDHLWIVTNADGATDFKLVRAPVEAPDRGSWEEVVPHRPGTKLEAVDAFADHLVLYSRLGGNLSIEVLDPDSGDLHVVDQPEPVYTSGPDRNHEFDAPTFRYRYTSMVTPLSTYEYDPRSRERRLLKQQPVLGGFDPGDYVTVREWATAEDGTRVPVSLVHRRDVELDGDRPAVLYGYGSYEHAVDPGFSSLRLSLLDRGFVFAIAHVRGGGELGRRWYEDGKFLTKRNTFTDFVACAEHLVQRGYTRPERLGIRGGSAGGLLIGAVLNLRPDLFGAAVAEVPFVDVVNTMLDESLPLTTMEYEEWGDPRERGFYDYIRSYAPYENVSAQAYPALLVTAGLNDPRVGYWEPAKWVAKLRAVATGDAPILLKTEMGAGHAGRSGRYGRWEDEAFVLAFLLDRLAPETVDR